MGILEDLLARGHFPVQLPPGFTTASASTLLPMYRADWDRKAKAPLTSPERFSVARSSYYRRGTALVNPIGFYAMAKEIAKSWPDIEAHYAKSQLSRSTPKFGAGGLRAISIPRFTELHEEKITRSAGHRFALVTDITTFFPSLYTHAIPWALHSKAIAKAAKVDKKLVGNRLDLSARSLQDGQTVGIPVGPDTSHILAELVGVSIDLELFDALGQWPQGFRYVDDFYLFFDTRAEAERALAMVTRALGRYELQINAAKTRIVEVTELIEESWKYGLRQLKISSKGLRQQRDAIHHYFEAIFSMEKRFKDESLIKYGLKQVTSTIIKRSNWPVFESYLLKCGFSFPNTLQMVTHLLATYNHHMYELNGQAIGRFANSLIRSSATSNHHSEVIWLLWLLKELKLAPAADVVPEILRMNSSACTLVLLDLDDAAGALGIVNPAQLAAFATGSALESSDWLLAYEGGRRTWIGNSDTRFIEEHPFFGPLLSAGVYYYDTSAKLPPIFDFKVPPFEPSSFDFDDEQAFEESFKFDDMDDEYFDSDSEHTDDDDEKDGEPD